jgi:hypothetical protein
MNSTVQTRGERNNNPGNIRKDGRTVWKGQLTSGADPSFVTFLDANSGIRALAVILKNYQTKHGLRTLRDIINRWAPPVENNTEAYINAVCTDCSITDSEVVDLAIPSVLVKVVKAIIHHENGRCLYSDDNILQVVKSL